jgi:hypothetical protein
LIKLLTSEAFKHQLEVHLGGNRKGPKRAIEVMALQQAAGLPVVQALDFNAILLAASARMSSLPQVCAALSAWADMSEKILKYNPEETLPPRSEADAARFLGAFDNGRTASNYCSSVYWACESALSLWCGWRTDALAVKIRGLRKRAARQATTAGFANVLLEEDMKGVVAKADVSGTMVYPVFALTASQCLFRVQSECIPLEVGAPTEVGRLPLGRHSAVYIEGESTAAVAHFDLDKRKNWWSTSEPSMYMRLRPAIFAYPTA